MNSPSVPSFSELALSPAVFQALEKVGYERPSPIQALTIPLLLDGRDVIGQAQTGTGKTAAFALPLLSKLNLRQKSPQVLVLAPTRELAIQVAEAFQTYAAFIPGFHVLPIYGGQDFRGQLQGLKRGAHVVVGTPGRVMDHMRRGTLDLSGLTTIVLDEADEMLRMGFIDDVEWVLEQAPAERQIALFSATMPPPIRKIATHHLRSPEHVTIAVKTVSAETIRQRYWPVRGINKLDALTRILEAESFTAMLIFVRTKTSTVELSDKLSARGFASSAINGDMSQQLRESTIDKLKRGKLDLLVATDVAARGLDVDRISHVVNYDIPYDVETYIHRIGRTGRAGREGDAILFVAPREQRMLGAIERATRKKIELMELPSTELINDRRVGRFMEQISDTLEAGGLEQFEQLVARYEHEHNVPALEIAAALARLLQGNNPLFLEKARPSSLKEAYKEKPAGREFKKSVRDAAAATRQPRERKPAREQSAAPDETALDAAPQARPERAGRPRPEQVSALEEGMERYRIEVGHDHDVKPGNIVGAIANEADLDSKYIGRIQIFEDHSLVDLPAGMPPEVFQHLKKVWVAKRLLNITHYTGGNAGADTGEGTVSPAKRSAGNGAGGDAPKKSGKKAARRDNSQNPRPDFKTGKFHADKKKPRKLKDSGNA